jgi:response regulator of citrate/malate metabolism
MDGNFLMAILQLRPISGRIYVFIVSYSTNKTDISRSRKIDMVTDYLVKPLFKEKLSEILQGIRL